MKCFLLMLASMVVVGMASAAEAPRVTFYLQFVRASDVDTPPAPDAKLVGPKLAQRLHGVFKWKNYWDVKHETVSLKVGEKARRAMNPKREVELVLDSPKQMTVSLYVDGKLSRKRRQSVETRFYITGGDPTDAQPWFIVVRRDKPPESTSTELGAALRY